MAILTLYFLVMRLGSGSWNFTLSELYRLRFWVTPLILGFGTQVGLFSYLKNCHRIGKTEGGTTVTSTATSSVAMLACCTHHLTDFLPFLGLATVATFLVSYQQWFLSLGILSNLAGIFLMIRQIRRMKK